MIKINKFCFILILLITQTIALEYPTPQWIIWNVGQGQWITHVEGDRCWHYDFGGERNPISEVIKYCAWRQNHLILSHADRDHYNFISSMRQYLKQICLWGPAWKHISLKKVKALGLPECKKDLSSDIHFFNLSMQKKGTSKKLKKISLRKNNDYSQIVNNRTWLIPGDAPQSTEKQWVLQTRFLPKGSITKLVLGHHGSKTSTSLELLQTLPHLNQCIASSRQKKYGHPHREVRIRIQKFCHLVRTEDWHHLHYLETGEKGLYSNPRSLATGS